MPRICKFYIISSIEKPWRLPLKHIQLGNSFIAKPTCPAYIDVFSEVSINICKAAAISYQISYRKFHASVNIIWFPAKVFRAHENVDPM